MQAVDLLARGTNFMRERGRGGLVDFAAYSQFKIELYIHHALVCRPCIDGWYRAYLSIGVLEGTPWPENLSCRPFYFSKERDCCCRPGCLTRKHRFFYEYESRRAVGRRSPQLPQPSRFFSHSLSRRLYKLMGTRQTDWKCSGHFILTLCTK